MSKYRRKIWEHFLLEGLPMYCGLSKQQQPIFRSWLLFLVQQCFLLAGEFLANGVIPQSLCSLLKNSFVSAYLRWLLCKFRWELAWTFIIELRKNCWPFFFVVSEQIVETVHRKWGYRKLWGLNRRKLKKIQKCFDFHELQSSGKEA